MGVSLGCTHWVPTQPEPITTPYKSGQPQRARKLEGGGGFPNHLADGDGTKEPPAPILQSPLGLGAGLCPVIVPPLDEDGGLCLC